MSDLMRREFEAWAKKRGHSCDVYNGGYYGCDETRNLWEAWQAARESLTIEMPHSSEFDSPTGASPAIEECRNAIHAAGIKTK